MRREAFLNRIAERLGRPSAAAPPERSEGGVPDFYRADPLAAKGEPVDLCDRFKRELESVGGRVTLVRSSDEVGEALRAELSHWGAKRLVSWSKSEFAAWDLGWLWAQGVCEAWGDGGTGADAATRFRHAALDADVGVTTVDFAIANTGTMVVSASTARPRSVSLAPTIHLALVLSSQMVDRMGAVFAEYTSRAGGPPSAVHFITGPSRTSDIENDLTIGVHGPAAVSAIVWQREPS
jgi:L-lactate dehydrogenase complex protein LldG